MNDKNENNIWDEPSKDIKANRKVIRGHWMMGSQCPNCDFIMPAYRVHAYSITCFIFDIKDDYFCICPECGETIEFLPMAVREVSFEEYGYIYPSQTPIYESKLNPISDEEATKRLDQLANKPAS